MTQILHYVYDAVAVVLLFGAAIFVHEFGHYWVARRRGLKVLEFAIGFGPKIFGWTRDGIDYSVRWIPAGGYVKLPQMITSSAIEGEEGSQEKIPPAPPFSKILVAVAGPFMNVVFAFAIAGVIYFVGLPVLVNPSIIGYVEPDSAEAKLGVREGDKIVAINGKPVKSWQEVHAMTMVALTNVLPVTVERGAETLTFNLKAEPNEMIGLKMLNLNPRDHPVIKGIKSGSAAESAHLQVNDEVIALAGVPISSREQFVGLVQKRGGEATPIVVKRGGQKVNLQVTPALDPGTKIGRIGVELGSSAKEVYQIEHPSPWSQIVNVWEQMVSTFSALIHSRQSGVKASDLAGPVGIISSLAAQAHADYRLALNFLVLLNINLALLNMLPVPVLDGGHILMAIIERIRRKPLSIRFVEYTTTAFAILLLSFMLYVTFFDVKRLSLFRSMFKREVQIEQVEKPTGAPATNSAQ